MSADDKAATIVLRRLLLLVFLLAAVVLRGGAALPGFTHREWTASSGLPDQEIQAITQTKDGFLWLGTPHGLFRFDGFRFKRYGLEIPQLQQFGVSSLLAASDGSLWVGSPAGGGLVHIFKPVQSPASFKVFLASSSVRALYQEPNGIVWVGTDAGIFYEDGDHFQGIGGVGRKTIGAITADGHGGIWFGGARLIHRDRGVFKAEDLPDSINPHRVWGLAVDGEDRLWVGTQAGLYVRKGELPLAAVRGVNGPVRSLRIDAQGTLLIGTYGDGLLAKREGGAFEEVYGSEQPNGKLILSCFTDASGDTWFSTQSGLVRLSQTGITLFRATEASRVNFSSVFVDGPDSVLFSFGPVVRFHDGRVHRALLPPTVKTLVRSIYRDPTGVLWIGTMGQGAFRVLPDGSIQDCGDLGNSFVTGFQSGDAGSVWIGTDSGAALWRQGKVTSFQHAEGAPHLAATAMATEADGTLWLGTERGLYQLTGQGFHETVLANTIGHRRIWSILRTRAGQLWIGTENGAYLRRSDGLFKVSLTTADRSSAVTSILEDARGRVLIAQGGTIFRLNPEAERFAQKIDSNHERILQFHDPPESFAATAETGAVLAEGGPQVAQADDRGGAWYATDLGALHITDSAVARDETVPPVVVERVSINGREVKSAQRIVLPSSVEYVEIDATPILLSARSGLHLRRQLTGFDKDWSEFTPGSPITYSNLPPGRYMFRVEAYWGEGGPISAAEVELIQKAAFWETPWFIALCVLAVMAGVWGFQQAKIHQMRLRFNAVMAERTRVARELHDTVLQDCIGVSSLLEAVARSQVDLNSGGAEDRRWLDTLNFARGQIKETISSARNAILNLRSTEQRGSFYAAVCELAEHLVAGTDLKLSITGGLPPLIPTVEHELLMATREAVINVVKHARASSLRIELMSSASSLAVTVLDDGVGFEPGAHRDGQQMHFGLASMSERMALIGGCCHLQSEKGGGTSVVLSLPCNAGS